MSTPQNIYNDFCLFVVIVSHSVAHSVLELTAILLPVSRALGLQACTSTTRLLFTRSLMRNEFGGMQAFCRRSTLHISVVKSAKSCNEETVIRSGFPDTT